MSGPKRSQYAIDRRIQQEIAAELRRDAQRRRDEYLARRKAVAREKAEIRAGKEGELRTAIMECRQHLQTLVREFGTEVIDARRVENWLTSAEAHAKGDLRDSWKELNGAKSFLIKKENSLKRSIPPQRHQKEEPEELPEPSEAELLLGELEDVLSNNSEISNVGITQRLDLLRGALKVNPNNPNTLEQVQALLTKVNEIADGLEIRKKEREYVIRAFAEVIGAEPPSPSTGQAAMSEGRTHQTSSSGEKGSPVGGFPPSSFSGSIGGMPITVTFEDEKNIRLNTPENGDCKTPLKSLMKKLESKGVSLANIRIDRTGENWNPVSTENVSNRIRA